MPDLLRLILGMLPVHAVGKFIHPLCRQVLRWGEHDAALQRIRRVDDHRIPQARPRGRALVVGDTLRMDDISQLHRRYHDWNSRGNFGFIYRNKDVTVLTGRRDAYRNCCVDQLDVGKLDDPYSRFHKLAE